jgi:hypothetical protein
MHFGKLLIYFGVALIVARVVVALLARMDVHLGQLPGDFIYRGKNSTVYFPLATSLLASVMLSLFLYLMSRSRK